MFSTLLLPFLSLVSLSIGQQCSQSTSEYRVSYYIDGCTERAVFEVTHDLTSTKARTNGANNIWSGLGIGMGRSMRDIDFIQLNVDLGKAEVSVVDMRVKGFTSPSKDSGQDVSLDSYSLNGSILKAKFSRNIRTADDDADLEMTHDLILPRVGGTTTAEGRIGRHKSTPRVVSGVRVADCRRECNSGGNTPPVATTAKTTAAPVAVGKCDGQTNNAGWCDAYLTSFRRNYGERQHEACVAFARSVGSTCKLTSCKCE